MCITNLNSSRIFMHKTEGDGVLPNSPESLSGFVHNQSKFFSHLYAVAFGFGVQVCTKPRASAYRPIPQNPFPVLCITNLNFSRIYTPSPLALAYKYAQNRGRRRIAQFPRIPFRFCAHRIVVLRIYTPSPSALAYKSAQNISNLHFIYSPNFPSASASAAYKTKA